MLGTVIGSVVGAIGANALEHKHKKHKEEKKYENDLAYGGGYAPQGSSHGGSSYGVPSAVGGLYPGFNDKKHKKDKRHRSRSRSVNGSSSDSD
jgi:hypothetical protein